MTILDIIRQRTYEIKDSLVNITKLISQAEAERDAAEETWKRTRGDISKKKEHERVAKDALADVAAKIDDLKKTQEELERKLQEANEAYFLSLEEETTKQKELRIAENLTKTAIAEMKKGERTWEDAKEHIAQLRADQDKFQGLFRQQLDGALEEYLMSQADHLQRAFLNEEQMVKAKQDQEEFEKLRHSDAEIAELWEQRIELSGLLANSKITAVRNILQERLSAVDEELRKRHPGSVRVEAQPQGEGVIEELIYFFNGEGKAVLFLPISKDDWYRLEKGEVTDRATRIMCLVWNMINEMKLKSQDGSFIPFGKFMAYESCLGREDVSILQGFSVKCKDAEISRFILTEVPAELQAVISHES